MDTQRTRYPGAQSFADDAASRAVFFGRDDEIVGLCDLVVTHRLVVVYAKSGIGKTSLINAGVSQPLRDAGFLPLGVRVNLADRALTTSVFEMTRAAAQRQGVEYHPGSERSLWHFFQTAEFWREDRLLTPVLVLDQFEELFTLQTESARAAFLAELGQLSRGVPPPPKPGEEADDLTALPSAPRGVRIVVSLREDYLGYLEEAADYLPDIMSHRFRLLPLTTDAAMAAMQGPSQVRNALLQTAPFKIEAEALQGILQYLQRRTGRTVRTSVPYIEPFHLQLICQRVEMLAARKRAEATGGAPAAIGWPELGGDKGLRATLRNFYTEIADAMPTRRLRRRVRELCEQHLISAAGRRLSLEESEIGRLVKIDRSTLRLLVDRRLLRADERAESWYYELSHDSLIEPILETRRVKAIVLGVSGFLGAVMVCMIAIGAMLAGPVLMYVGFFSGQEAVTPKQDGEIFVLLAGVIFFAVLGVFIFAAGRSGLRRSIDMLNRFVPPSR